MKRQGEVAVREDDGIVYGNELRPVLEGALDLHLVDQRRDAREHLPLAEDAPPHVHEVGDALAVTDELQQLRREERDGFGVVEPKPAREPLLREEARAVKEQFVDVAGREMHGWPSGGRKGIHGIDVRKVSQATARLDEERLGRAGREAA